MVSACLVKLAGIHSAKFYENDINSVLLWVYDGFFLHIFIDFFFLVTLCFFSRLCFSYLQHHFLSHGYFFYFFYFFKWYGISLTFISNIMNMNTNNNNSSNSKQRKNKRKQLFGSHFITAHCFFPLSFKSPLGIVFIMIQWDLNSSLGLSLSTPQSHCLAYCTVSVIQCIWKHLFHYIVKHKQLNSTDECWRIFSGLFLGLWSNSVEVGREVEKKMSEDGGKRTGENLFHCDNHLRRNSKWEEQMEWGWEFE